MSDVVTTTTTTSAEPHMYNAHLKKVLKSYQTAAMTSLNGPSSCMAAWAKLSALPSEPELKKGHHHAATPATTTAASVTAAPNAKRTPSADDNVTAKHVSDLDPFLAPPPFPIQQMPILTAPDQSRSERSETVLEGETISCFIVGGEKRLCLPQILNSVLRDFSLQQINAVCDELQIFCSRCNHEQLEVLKLTAILPFSAPSCGLITKTDAERLCNALLHSNPPRIASVCEPPDKRPFHFKVYHECFGKCKGIYTPDHYVVPHALCIECTECRGQFSPQKFVCHAHKALENRTCHWGFDSANWRSYILLATDQHNTEQLQTHLDEMKNRFDYNKYKRKQYEQEEKDLNKKAKYTADESSYMSYVYDPVLATYWYPPAWSRVSAFRPWSPMVSKDGKQSLPSQQSSYLRENVPQSLPSYLSHGPPVLLNPERVVPISETERFERHYQPNVALAPPSAQLQANQKILASVTTTSTSSYYSTANTGKDSNKSSEKLTSKEGAILPTEVDISTDTDETFSDSNASAESVDYVPEKGLKNGGEIPLVKIEESKNALIEEKDTAPIRKLLELRGVKQEILEDVMKEVEKLKERYRQELVAVLAAKKTYQQEVELIKSSRKEKLREAIEAKRNLRKELELVRTEHEKKLREALETQQQLRRELEANRNRRGDKINEVAARVNLTAENEQLRSRLEATENELQKLRSEMEKDSTTDGNTETLSGPSHLPSSPSVKLLSSPEKTKTQSTLLSVEKTKSE